MPTLRHSSHPLETKVIRVESCYIPAELIKAMGPCVVEMLHRLCISIWKSCYWPEDWKIQEFVVLFKSGDRKQCSIYRTIALISHTSKILLLIIVDRLKGKLETEQPEEHATYRKERGTRDMSASAVGESNSSGSASFNHVH